jgi:hypothetical protein
MGTLDELIKRLAQAIGLPEEDAAVALETAVDYVKAQRPDKADKVDTALSNEKTVKRIGDLAVKLADKVKPEEETLPRPNRPQADHHQPDGEAGGE